MARDGSDAAKRSSDLWLIEILFVIRNQAVAAIALAGNGAPWATISELCQFPNG
jgi:hypothetical protein